MSAGWRKIPAWVVGAAALTAITIPLIFLVVPGSIGIHSLYDYPGRQRLAAFRASFLFLMAATLVPYYLLPRARVAVLLAISLAFSFICYRPVTACTLIGATLCLPLLWYVRAGLLRHALFAAWLIAFIFWLPCYSLGMATDQEGGRNGWYHQTLLLGFLFSTFFKRGLWFYHDLVRRPSLRWSTLDVLQYMIGLPNLIGMSCTPSFAHFVESRTDDPAVVRKGTVTSLICVGWLLAAVLLDERIVPRWIVEPAATPDRVSLNAIWIVVLGSRAWVFISRLYNEQLSVGLWRLLGRDIRDDFKGPMRAASPVEFWRRWNLLWREFLLSVFFYPIVLALGRRYGARRPWIYAAAAMATFLGATLFDLFPWAWYVWRSSPSEGAAMCVWLLAYHAVQGALVAAGLYVEAARVPPAPSPAPRVEHAANVALTYVVLSLVNVCHIRTLSSANKLTILTRAFQ